MIKYKCKDCKYSWDFVKYTDKLVNCVKCKSLNVIIICYCSDTQDFK